MRGRPIIALALAIAWLGGWGTAPARAQWGARPQGAVVAARDPVTRTSRARASRSRNIPATAAPALPVRPGPESAPTRAAEGTTWMRVNDLARLLDATKYWRVDVRKLELRSGRHRILLAVDNPFVLVDDATIRLAHPVRSFRGEIQISVELLGSLPHDSTLARVVFDPGRGTVFQVPESGLVGPPRITVEGGITRLTFPVDRPDEVRVTSRSRAHFRVHLGGLFFGSMPDTMQGSGLIATVRPIAAAMGVAFELTLDREAAGFQMVRDPTGGRMTIVFATTAREGFETFAPEGAPGPRPLRVVAIDPGHGGSDAGVRVEGVVEKDLTLALARMVKVEIGRRLPARVVLTREDDVDVPAERRAERANRARADLVVSLHFGALPGSKARGATAFCPPATFGSSIPWAGEQRGEIMVLPWRDVATRHAVESRELAEDVLSSLELRGLGPTRLRELLPYSLLGVNAPGLLLECATLTSESDRGRLGGRGLAELASSIADGIEAYARGK
jgi:N-acetylmuramoyl-L-alanine amidase